MFNKIMIFLESLFNYRMDIIKKRQETILFNFDEIPIYFDMTKDSSFELKGIKEVEFLKPIIEIKE